jgi:hypothetical protein
VEAEHQWGIEENSREEKMINTPGYKVDPTGYVSDVHGEGSETIRFSRDTDHFSILNEAEFI